MKKTREKFEQLKKWRIQIDNETNDIAAMIKAAEGSAAAAKVKIVTLRADYDAALGRGDGAAMNSVLACIAAENKKTPVPDSVYTEAASAFYKVEQSRKSFQQAQGEFMEGFNSLKRTVEELGRDVMTLGIGGTASQATALRGLFEKRNL
jgi:hypothetical protein